MVYKKTHNPAEPRAPYVNTENRNSISAAASLVPILDKEKELRAARIREVIGKESIRAFAARCGLSDSLLGAYAKGQKSPGVKHLTTIANVGGVLIDWLASGRLPKLKPPAGAAFRGEEPIAGYVAIPLYNNVQAAAGAGALVGDEVADGFMRFSEEWLRIELGVRLRDLYLIRASGDSMEPTFRSGDALLVDRRAISPDREGIYIMRSGASLLVKRLQLLPGRRVRVSSDNPLYQPYELLVSELNDDDVVVIGRVVWSGRRL